MKKQTVANIATLIDAVAAGSMGEAGNPAVEITLWDGRSVIGTYDNEAFPDITSEFDFIDDDAKLRPFVEKLLADGASFVTQTGEDDAVCTLKWEIK